MRAPRLPRSDQVPWLVALLRGEAIEAPDHAALADAALLHNLGGFALRALDAGRWRPPPDVAERIRVTHGERTLVSGLLRLELGACAAALTEACGAAPIVVKGPAVAARLYPEEPSLRPYVDLDLLVPRERLRDAAAALAATRGFTLAEGERFFAAAGEPWDGFAEAYGHELALARTAAGRTLLVELQWRMSDDPLGAALDHAALVAHAAPLPGLPGAVPAPDAQDELLVVAVHLLHHEEPLLLWHADVARARDALSEAGWLGVFDRARERGLSWPLHEALDRVAAVLGGDRPRPEPKPASGGLGVLRATGALPVGVGVHVGRLAALGWRQRVRYVGRAAQASVLRARSRTARRSDSA